MFDPTHDKYRLLAVEYHDGTPHAVVALVYWNHTAEPWFRAGRDKPDGWTPHYFDFKRVGGALWYYASGMGGGWGAHCVCPIGGGRPWKVNRRRGRYQLWAAPDVRLVRWKDARHPRVRVRDADLPEYGWDRIPEPLTLTEGTATGADPLLLAEETTAGFTWCRHCRAAVLRDDLCEHITWCDDCGHEVYRRGGRWVDEETAVCRH